MHQANLLTVNRANLSRRVAAQLREQGTVWLDSAYGFRDRGRLSLFARRPVLEVSISGASAAIIKTSGETRRLEGIDGLNLLENLWSDPDLFSVGYITYEAALPFVDPAAKRREAGIPEMRFASYRSVLQIDHLAGTAEPTNREFDDYGDVLEGPEAAGGNDTGISGNTRLRFALSKKLYCRHVEQIKHHIHEGDIYQANYTTRLEVISAADPATVYMRLRDLSPSPYAAWLNFGDLQILSSSPERMFLKEGNAVTTGPIKGTIARGRNEQEDAVNLRTLLGSEKDRAELLMIVDLARNDLGRVAEIGSVRVDSIFRPEQYSSVHHLVGDISARLRSDCTTADLIRALLPGGSITGAPKKRATEIIGELEPHPRSVYTGCIGYVHGDRADFNIAIRTMIHRGGCYHVHAGGGIVADSQPVAEYDEMRLKAERMLAAVGLRKENTAWPE